MIIRGMRTFPMVTCGMGPGTFTGGSSSVLVAGAAVATSGALAAATVPTQIYCKNPRRDEPDPLFG